MGRFAIESWGVQAAVEWDHANLDQAAGDLLLPIWTHEPTLQPEAVFRLHHAQDGTISFAGPSEALRPMQRDDPVETLERRLHMHLASETRQAVYVHAGVVAWKGRAIIFPGRSYAGKSTLIQALVKAGADFLSDEYAIVDPDGWVHSFPRPISLRTSEGIRRVDARELGWRPTGPLATAAVIVANFQEGQTWEPDTITQGNAVLDLLSNTVSAQAAPALAIRCLSQTVSEAQCWKGVRGDAESTAVRILAEVDRGL